MTKPQATSPTPDIAVVGMSGRFPGAPDLAAFWRLLSEGAETITFFSDDELRADGVPEALLQDPEYVKAGSVLEGIDRFDAAFFGISPREAESMDPQHRLFLECAWHALEDAGYTPEGFDGAVGVYAGCARSTYWDHVNRFPDFVNKVGFLQVMIGNEKDYLTTHASYKLNLKGPSVCVQSSCSTSLVAISQACQALRAGQCDLALAGGACVRVPDRRGYHYLAGGIFSPDGHCRVFDADARGMIFGNGIGLVVLRRLGDALKAGDPVRAVIKGVGLNNDGSGKGSYTAPSVEGQAAAIAAALKAAGASPETISYVEAHGTGTVVGDPVEVTALTRAFRQGTDRAGYCALGSVKTNFGHLDHAAGVAGFMKTVLALEHRQIPPSLHFRRPNPAIDFEAGPFYVNTELADWQPKGGPRRAGVSSFSIGGTNAHVVLEEAPAPERSGKSRPCQLLTVSARSAVALEAAAADLADHLARHPDLDLADVAYTRHVGRRAFAHRRFVLCSDLKEAVAGLRAADPERVGSGAAPAAEPPVAFLFSGQGAQYVYMALDLLRVEPVFREHLEACADQLRPHLGADLRRLLYPPAVQAEEATAQLRQTANTQAALFTVEYALARLLMSWGVRPAAMLGHSLGEYVAACLAGVFPVETALALVAERGRLMQALPAGAMLAVGLPERELVPLLGRRVCLAAVNEPSQCVVSGPADAINELEATLLRRRVTCRRLQTSHAFHSRMMDPILENYAAFVKRFELKEPQVPYVSNVTGTWADPAAVTDPAYWADHIRKPVRFAEGLGCLLRGPARVLLEVGPGQVLSSFARRHPDKSSAHTVLSTLRGRQERKSDTEFLLRTLGRLWLAGAPVDWPGFYAYERRRRVSLPGYPFERQRYWVEAPANSPPTRKPDVADWFYLPAWAEAEAAAAEPTPADGQQPAWLVFQDDLGAGADLVDRLERSGRDAVVVRPGPAFARVGRRAYQIDPRDASHYHALVGDLAARGGVPGRIAHLWSLSDDRPAEDFDAAQDAGFYPVIHLAQALVAHNVTDRVRVGVVTNHVHRLADDEGVCAARATVLGACTVVSQEYPNLRCFSVDVGPLETAGLADGGLAERLVAEFEGELPGTVLAYRDGRRLRQTFAPARVDRPLVSGPLLRREGVYLITGGLGRIGLALAKALGRHLRARLVLVGRSRLPEREGWDEWLAARGAGDPVSRRILALREIEGCGARVLPVAADVSCPDQMGAVLDRARAEFGALHGVIHGAGSLSAADFLALDQLDRAACERHFAPKARGALVLRELLRGRGCDFCLLLSSLSSVLGGLGYLGYAAGNAFLDAFAREADDPAGTRWYCVNWDQWSFPEAPADGLAMLPEEGVETFLRFLGEPPAGQVLVSTHDLQGRVSRWVDRTEGVGSRGGDGAGLHARPELATDYAAPQDPAELTVAAIFQEALGIQGVGRHDNFFDLGGQSLLATEVVARIRSAFHLELPLRQFFEGPTVAALAAALAEGSACANGTNGTNGTHANGSAAPDGVPAAGANGHALPADEAVPSPA
jgi:acyl transferase domain-containing protein/acyl carrier protein